MVKNEKTAESGAASLLDAAKTLNDANKRGDDASSVTNVIDLEQYRIDTTADVVTPEYRIEIGGVGVLPPGITAVSGRAKQGKSSFLNVVAATLLSNRPFGTMRPRTSLKEIVWIDTEQEAWEIQINYQRLMRAAGFDERTDAKKLGLHIFALRPLNVEERRNVVVSALNAYPNAQMLILDGLRDLLHDFNDVTESNDTMQLLMDATARNKDLSLIAVLHKNDSNDKMRGHLGTELLNKCNTAFNCNKDNGVFTVTNISRQKEAEPFRFCINDAGNYAPSDAVNAAGIINDRDALELCFGEDEGLQFDILVQRYKKHSTAATVKQAKQIIIEKIKRGEIIKNAAEKLFYLA